MSFIPGDVGQKTILTDGAQIDHLSENTVGHGIAIQGKTDGVALSIDAVGYTKVVTQVAGVIMLGGANVYTSVLSIVIPKGVWSINATYMITYTEGSTTGTGYGGMGVSTSSVNTFPDKALNNSIYVGRPLARTGDNFAVAGQSLPGYVVNNFVDTTYYLKGWHDYAGTAPSVGGSISATRIA